MGMVQKVLSMSQQLLIGEALKYAAHNVADREVYIDGDYRLTYRELLTRSQHLAWTSVTTGKPKGAQYYEIVIQKEGKNIRNDLPKYTSDIS